MSSTGSEPTRRRLPVRWLVICLGVLVLLAGLALHTSRSLVSVGFAPFRSGSFGYLYYDHLTVAYVTNQSTSAITLQSGVLQWARADGSLVNDNATLWGGKGNHTRVLPQEAVPLPLAVPPSAVKFRLAFAYGHEAAGLRGVVSSGVRKLPRKLLVNRWGMWMVEHGWISGVVWTKCKTPWMANEAVPSSAGGASDEPTARTAPPVGPRS